VVPAKSKYTDRKSSAYLRGMWLKKKYQTVILTCVRLVDPGNDVPRKFFDC
jgi:hypothetical protein